MFIKVLYWYNSWITTEQISIKILIYFDNNIKSNQNQYIHMVKQPLDFISRQTSKPYV